MCSLNLNSNCKCKSNPNHTAPRIVIQHTLHHTFLVAKTTATSSDTNSINYYIYSLHLSHHAGRSCMHVLTISKFKLQKQI